MVTQLAKALVFLAPGFEEIEASTIVDILRRCGVEVTVTGLIPGLVEGSHGMKFGIDATIDAVSTTEFDAVICPGGAPGFENLRKNRTVISLIQEAFKSFFFVKYIYKVTTFQWCNSKSHEIHSFNEILGL